MKIPRDIPGRELAKALAGLGYAVTHQTGSHMRLTTRRGGEHHITIPAARPIHVGTLNAILHDVAAHHGMSRQDLLTALFG